MPHCEITRVAGLDTKRFASGQAIVLATIALVVLLGSVAMAVDVGFLWNRKRQVQTAADAAAVAAARSLLNASNDCGNANVNGAAYDVATINGFTDGSDGVTVTPSCPPADGAYAGVNGYIEVVIQQTVPTYFLRVFGYTTVNVAARAVSSNISSGNCMVVLAPTGSGALNIHGTGTALTLDCNVTVNSNSSTALTMGGGATLTANAVGVVGGYSGGGITPTPVTHIAPAADPLAYLQPPGVGTCASTNCTVKNNATFTNCTGATTNGTTVTLQPGVYCSANSSSAAITAKGATIFSPGTYILNGGGMVVNAGATLSGTGVTFYNTGTASTYGGITMSGNPTANLSAPTSGPLTGILFFQDRSIPVGSAASSVTGGSNSSFTGTLYFPTSKLIFSGGGGTAAYTIFVAYTLDLGGGTGFKVNALYSDLSGGSPLKKSVLNE